MTIRQDDPTLRPPVVPGWAGQLATAEEDPDDWAAPPEPDPDNDWVARSDGWTLETEAAMDSAVNHPSHYNVSENGLECFDAIVGALGVEGAVAYAKGAALKYIWRADHKGKPAEDLRKGAVYLNWAADLLDKGPKRF